MLSVKATELPLFKIEDAPGTNVVLKTVIRSDYVVVDLTTATHNWWMM
jgi:hypothetical protein